MAELDESFTLPAELDPVGTLEDHLAMGWENDVEVVIDAPPESVARWLPRSLGYREAIDAHTTRLVATTSNPRWYVGQLAMLHVPYRIVGSAEIRAAAQRLGHLLLDASTG